MALNRSDKSRILRRYFPGMTRNSEMSTEPSRPSMGRSWRSAHLALFQFPEAGPSSAVCQQLLWSYARIVAEYRIAPSG